jgi:hypothetical protein
MPAWLPAGYADVAQSAIDVINSPSVSGRSGHDLRI